jgi:hypothetical protein
MVQIFKMLFIKFNNVPKNGNRSGKHLQPCRSDQGVQLEISRGLRKKMFDKLNQRTLRKKTIVFYKFIRALREVLDPLNQGRDPMRQSRG